ncbi:MAG: GFA family protein [Dongiaceae bacterium]
MLTGGCQCGAVRYECDAEPLALYVCHCRECRRQSASAFGMSLAMPVGTIRVTRGAPKFWTRPAASGRRVRCAFCPDCGTRLWHEPAAGDYLSIKAGSLDQPVDISDAIHIWTSRKLPGTVIPAGAVRFPEEPD